QVCGIAAWLGAFAFAWELQQAVTGDTLQLTQERNSLRWQWHQMRTAALHAFGGAQPEASIVIKLRPARLIKLVESADEHRQQLQAYADIGCMGVGANGPEQSGQFLKGYVGKILHRFGQ